MKKIRVICIGRQFGSGGREIGEKLAKKLSFGYYDKELLKIAAKESGIMPELFEKADEKPINSLLYSLSVGAQGQGAFLTGYQDYLTNDKLFLFQSDTIRKLAQRESCVIIGRCADYILRGRDDILRVFIHAPLEQRVERICRLYDLDEKAALSLIKKTDKRRASYYGFFTDLSWGSADTYDVCLNSAALGIDGCIALLADLAGHDNS